MRTPVVLQVLPALVAGGVERGAIDVARAVAAEGWRSLVASAGGPMAHELERGGAIHLTLPLDTKNPFRLGELRRHLVDAIHAHGVDIVHARSRFPAWPAFWAARHTGAHFVTTFHGTYSLGLPGKRRYNAVMTRGERVIANSHFIAQHIVETYGTDPRIVRVIPRGVDLETFDPDRVPPERMIALAEAWRLPDGVPVVMLPGRLTRWKGHAVLIEALARLRDLPLRCLLVGDGRPGYRVELERLAERRGLAGVVHLTGHCRDMPAAYKLADVVVSASTEPEAFGRVAVEAQAMGRMTIATDLGAARETVIPGETGWLVPAKNPKALADALREALTLEPARRERIAGAAMAHARSGFTRADMCARTLAVYREVLGLP